MQLKTSYFSRTIFIKNITRFWPIWTAYLLIWLFAMPVSLWNLLTAPEMISEESSFVQTIITSQIYRAGFITGSSMTGVFGILAAMAVFSYLFVNKSACMYHALPVKREGLFLSNYLSGLLFVVVPNVIVFILSAIVKSVCGYADLGTLLSWLGIVSAMSLFFYSFGVFCAMFTGHILALPVFYVILNFIAAGLELLVKMVLSTFVFGMRMNENITLGFLSPFYHINTMTTAQDNKIICWNIIAGYAVAGIVFAVLALLIYRKRNIETAGDIVAVKPVKPVFKYGAAFSMALLFGYVLYEICVRGNNNDSYSAWRMLACMLPAGFVGYYAAEMLLKKSFHVIRRGICGWLVFCGVLIVLTTAMKLDVFGYERNVPDASAVSEVYTGQYINFPSNGSIIENNVVITDDEEKIRAIIALHNNIVENKAVIENYKPANSTHDGVFSPNSTPVAIYYIMKDGSRIYRSYTIPVTEALLSDAGSPAAAFEAFINEPENVLSRNFPDALSKNDFGNGHAYSDHGTITVPGGANNGNPTILTQTDIALNQDESYRLYLAIVKDIEAGNIGKIHLVYNDEYYNTVYSCSVSLQFNGEVVSWNSYNTAHYNSEYANFHVEKNSLNTIAVLKSLGLDDSQLITLGEAAQYSRG